MQTPVNATLQIVLGYFRMISKIGNITFFESRQDFVEICFAEFSDG